MKQVRPHYKVVVIISEVVVTSFRLQQIPPPYWTHSMLQKYTIVNLHNYHACKLLRVELHTSRNTRSTNNHGVRICHISAFNSLVVN